MKTLQNLSVRGLLLPLLLLTHFSFAQKFIFSNTPSSATAAPGKQQFKSGEYIYGRMELPTTVDEFFKIPKKGVDSDHPATILLYTVTVEKDGERLGSSPWPNMRITTEQKASKYINFDVLPQPKEATTMTCGLADYSSNVGSAPLYFMFNRTNFPGNGKYTVKIKMQYWSFDPYNPGLELPEAEWITASGQFDFDFNTADLQRILANKTEADNLVKENARVKAMDARGLPKEWSMKNTITNGLTEKQMSTLILNNEKAQAKLIKLVMYPIQGPGWVIEKNDVGIPIRKWHNQTIGYFSESEGHCYYKSGGLRQQYKGGGQYGTIFYEVVDSMEINCKNIPASSPPTAK